MNHADVFDEEHHGISMSCFFLFPGILLKEVAWWWYEMMMTKPCDLCHPSQESDAQGLVYGTCFQINYELFSVLKHESGRKTIITRLNAVLLYHLLNPLEFHWICLFALLFAQIAMPYCTWISFVLRAELLNNQKLLFIQFAERRFSSLIIRKNWRKTGIYSWKNETFNFGKHLDFGETFVLKSWKREKETHKMGLIFSSLTAQWMYSTIFTVSFPLHYAWSCLMSLSSFTKSFGESHTRRWCRQREKKKELLNFCTDAEKNAIFSMLMLYLVRVDVDSLSVSALFFFPLIQCHLDFILGLFLCCFNGILWFCCKPCRESRNIS